MNTLQLTPEAFHKACKQYDNAPVKPNWYVSVTVTYGKPIKK